MIRESLAFRVEQTVHGYRNGHRRLGGSIELDERSAANMLGLSDLLAEPVRGDTYLIGYPLKDCNRYVLARTWLAPEMRRPGCVWTHSLLIDYAALAQLPNPGCLTELFRRPSKDTVDGFSEPLTFAPPKPAQDRDELDPGHVASVVRQLYGAEGRALLLAGRPEEDERLALATWRQMWSRMRRSFFFCTSTAASLAPAGIEGSLEFLVNFDSERSDQSRGKPELSEGFSVLAEDLPGRSETPLRRFLARYAPELPDHRLAAPALAAAFRRMSTARSDKDISAGIRQIDQTFAPGQGRLLKSDLLLGRFREPARVGGEAARDFKIAFSQLAGQPSPVEEEVLGARLSSLEEAGKLDGVDLVQAAVGKPKRSLGGMALKFYATAYPVQAASAAKGPAAKLAVAKLNPKVMVEQAFWDVPPAERQGLIELAFDVGLGPVELLELLAETLAADEVSRLAGIGGAPAVRHVLQALPNSLAISKSVDAWGPLVGRHPEEFRLALPLLGTVPDLLDRLIIHVVRTPAEFVLDDTTLARYVPLWRTLANRPVGLAVVALLRGLNQDAYMAGDLIGYGLDKVLEHQRAGKLDRVLCEILDERLPWLNYFSSGPLDLRLIDAVARKYFDAARPELWLLTEIESLSLLKSVLSAVEARLFGRRLLKDLYEKAMKKGSGILSDRLNLLESIIWPYRR